MIGGCAGRHRKSRPTAGAIHRRNIGGRLQLIAFVWGRLQAINIGEVVVFSYTGLPADGRHLYRCYWLRLAAPSRPG
jgi:hypothetical protein